MPRKHHDAEAERKRLLELARRRSALGREVGPLPPITFPARRREAEKSLFRFLTEYHRVTFSLPFSDDHLQVIDALQAVIDGGGQQCIAMPRGSGKTSLCVAALEWAILSARRRFGVLISADENSAANLLDQILIDLTSNEALAEDWPEVCWPLSKLEGITQRTAGQTLDGLPTKITVTRNRIVLPTVVGAACSGSIIEVRGLTGSIRGMGFKLASGEILRPDVALIDDPQTDESAKSPSQCVQREALIHSTVLGLSGPTTRIAALAAVTVIRKDDLADRLLDRESHSEWQGIRLAIAKSLPDDLDLWDQYGRLRAECLREGRPVSEANDFYHKNRLAMDHGCKPSWSARMFADEVSPIQHLMNLRIRDPYSFSAEYMNDPAADVRQATELTASDITSRLSHVPRGIIPENCTHLTMGIDVQHRALYYAVIAWEQNNTGYLVDASVFPEQRREYFTLRDITNTLQKKFDSEDVAACCFAGLTKLLKELKPYSRQDGVAVPMSRILIDGGGGVTSEAVKKFTATYQRTLPVITSFGRVYRPNQIVNDPFRSRAGDRSGPGWRLPKATAAGRHVLFNANFWKADVFKRLRLMPGIPGSISLYGDDSNKHRMLADHVLAERSSIVSYQGEEYEEFHAAPNRDNHILDCLVMASVAASVEGITPITAIAKIPAGPERRENKRVKFSEVAAKKIAAYQSSL